MTLGFNSEDIGSEFQNRNDASLPEPAHQRLPDHSR